MKKTKVVNAWSLSGPARGARQDLQEIALFPLLRLIARIKVKLTFSPGTGPYVVVANHSSHLDCPIVLAALPRRIRTRLVVAAAADYFYKTQALGALASLALGTVPFERHEGSRDSLETLKDALRRGWSVLIFPEGTRSTTGEIGSFKQGVAYLAIDTRTSVLPIWIDGAGRLMPKGKILPRRGKVDVTIGEPVGPGPDETYGSFTKRIEDSVVDLARRAS